ncbi:MAG TPA: hypothetical protein VF507_07175, partial [Pyrinomonadaceae bacterium]
MKTLAALLLLLICIAAPKSSARASEDLYVSVIVTRSEHSRDSHSTTKSYKLQEGGALLYDEVSGGARRKAPVHKEYRLTAQEVVGLKKFIESNGLLTSGSAEYPVGGLPNTSLEMSVEIRLGPKRSLIEV